MLYLVLFPDGHLKAYQDPDCAAHCAAVDGGVVFPVAIAPPTVPAA